MNARAWFLAWLHAGIDARRRDPVAELSRMAAWRAEHVLALESQNRDASPSAPPVPAVS